MADAKPLALRRQKSRTSYRARRFARTASVWVDTKVFHLCDPLTYGIPEELEEVVVGSAVRVAVNNEIFEGIVASIEESSDISVKPLADLRDIQPIPRDFLASCRDLAARYGTSMQSILRFVSQVPKNNLGSSKQREINRKQKRQINYHLISQDIYSYSLAQVISSPTKTLLIAPTEREVEHLASLARDKGVKPLVLHSGITSSQRKRVIKEISVTDRCVVIATRGAILLPIPFNSIYILNELSPHYWEPRSPNWSVRDVALLRHKNEQFDLAFIGHRPSLEIARLIDNGFVRVVSKDSFERRTNVSFVPETFHQTIRRGLKNGRVLVSVVDKTYSNSFICSKCRNIPLCDCGGRLLAVERGRIDCRLCGKSQSHWNCKECGENKPFLLRRGAARIKEELAKAFPGVPMHLASAEERLVVPTENSITVATFGMEPLGTQFDALVLLDGEQALARYGLRSEEILHEYWLRLICSAKSRAPIYLSLPSSHRISQSLISAGPRRALEKELGEREALSLPPWRRIISVKGEESDLAALRDHLIQDHPAIIASLVTQNQLILRIAIQEAGELAKALFALQRYRSATRRKLLEIAVDPFEI